MIYRILILFTTMIKLILENFKCYRGKHSFEFTPDGITLISGTSGCGKSSILEAIHFVVCGNNRSKLVSDGCSSCKVSLEYDNLFIERSKKPNYIVVKHNGRQMESDVAQHYIYNFFGKNFEKIGYIQQNYNQSFIFLTPSEKLELLECLSFSDTPPEKHPEYLKKKCTKELKILNDEYNKKKGELSIVSEMTRKLKNQIDPIQEYKVEDDIHYTLSHIEQKIREEHNYYRMKEELEKLLEQKTNIDPLNHTINQLTLHIENWKKYTTLKNIQHPVLWEKYDEQECRDIIHDYKNDLKLLKEYKQLKDKIQQLKYKEDEVISIEEEIESVLRKSEGNFTCPSCLTKVSIVDDKLVLTTEQTIVSSSNKKEKINQLKHMKEKLIQQRDIVVSIQHRMDELEKIIDPNESIETMIKDLDWIQNHLENNLYEQKLFEKNQQQLQLLETQIIKELPIEKAQDMIQSIQLNNRIEQLQIQMGTFNTPPNFWEDQLRKYHNRSKKENYDNYITWCQREEDIKKELEILDKKQNYLSKLKQIILKTEIQVIEENMVCITNIVNQYLTKIFLEPISVDLKTTKKTQTSDEKIQIQLIVYYKNMKCDPSILSGGEQSRLNLAFIMAFSNVFHSPFVLLDECTSNLDQELTTMVLELIEESKQKVIMIAHQIVQGNFKQIIKPNC